MELIPLHPGKYRDYPIDVRYTTDRVYAVKTSPWGFSLELTVLPQPEEHRFSDTLFSSWLEDPLAFGLREDGVLLGIVEGSMESWHQLFRISNIFVQPEHRGKGLGSILLKKMIAYARDLPWCRGVILETQTCNYPAICLYRKHGFRLCSIDTHAYSNHDIETHEVRIDLFLEL